MLLFKRLKTAERKVEECEDRIVNLVLSVTKLGNELEEIKKKLPDYEEAVARGVDEVWNKAMSEVVNYDPFSYAKKGGNAE